MKTRASVPIAVFINNPGIKKLITEPREMVSKLNADCHTKPKIKIATWLTNKISADDMNLVL